MKLRRTLALLPVVFLAVSPLTAADANAPANPFPFVLPWDDATPGPTDCRAWFPRPAALGHVTVGKDGHFLAAGGQFSERIRFLGVNFSFAAGMPEPADAPKLAGRLAKFGVNGVRFHHMDSSPWPNGLCSPGGASGRLDPAALDRLDFFIAQLRQEGIYANLNLLVGRPFRAADGLPPEIEQLDSKERQVPATFMPAMLRLQQDYARALLTHTNAYTKLPYTSDPGVAFVEILNEAGLLHAWLGGNVDKLPEVFLKELRQQWHAWLRQRHGTTEKLRSAWAEGAQAVGAELLANGSFSNGIARWNVERHEAAKMEAAFDAEAGGLRLQIEQAGKETWHLQLNQGPFALRGGQAYTVRFRAKADAPRAIGVAVSQGRAPWGRLGLGADAALTREWKEFRFVFNAGQDEEQARLAFSQLGATGDRVWLADVSLRPGGVSGLAEGESLEAGLPLFTQTTAGERTRAAQLDWLRFLRDTEELYWQAMARFLKDEPHVQALIAGTIGGCSTPTLMAQLDWVDAHAYWQHPRFPGRPWDLGNWTVDNKTMVNEVGGTLPGLAARRVFGKPFTVTEYNHPAPNTFSSEGLLLLAAYGALQDWDAIYAYSFAHTRPSGWNGRAMSSFFDIDQHPAKMATLVPAAAMFRRADVRPARQTTAPLLTVDRELDLLRKARSWDLVSALSLGVPPATALRQRIGIALPGLASVSTTDPAPAVLGQFPADTGELFWNLTAPGRGVVMLDNVRSMAVIGYGGGRRFDLSGIIFEPGQGLQDGWCALTATAIDKGGSRWLITATGYAENTDMQWKNAQHSTVGRDWGRAPSRVEGVSAKVIFPKSIVPLKAWALDERGQRGVPVPVTWNRQKGASLEIGPQWRTLWYEVAAE